MNRRAKDRQQKGWIEDEDEAPAEEAAPQRLLATPQAGVRTYAVGDEDAGSRLDRFLALQADAASEALSRTRIRAGGRRRRHSPAESAAALENGPRNGGASRESAAASPALGNRGGWRGRRAVSSASKRSQTPVGDGVPPLDRALSWGIMRSLFPQFIKALRSYSSP